MIRSDDTIAFGKIKAEILADPVLTALAAQDNSGADDQIAAALNTLASPDFLLWRSGVPTQDIFDAITWASYTPVDPVPTAAVPSMPTETEKFLLGQFEARLLIIQTKQMNLQNMLISRDSISAGKSILRAGLRDALIQLPAGAGGALISAAGASAVNVLTILTRKALRAEKVLAGAQQTTGSVTANLIGYEGLITRSDVNIARNS